MTLSAPSASAAFTRPSIPPTSAADVALAASLPDPELPESFAGGEQAASARTLRLATSERRRVLLAITAPPADQRQDSRHPRQRPDVGHEDGRPSLRNVADDLPVERHKKGVISRVSRSRQGPVHPRRRRTLWPGGALRWTCTD